MKFLLTRQILSKFKEAADLGILDDVPTTVINTRYNRRQKNVKHIKLYANCRWRCSSAEVISQITNGNGMEWNEQTNGMESDRME